MPRQTVRRIGSGAVSWTGRPRGSPPEHQARGAALQIILIGVALAAVLRRRPRGLLGEEAVVSRHVKE